MKVLYGVVGEGMGHATRSRVILEHLLAKGHELHIVVSGRAHKFLTEKMGTREDVTIHEIEGLNLKFDGNDLDVGESILLNLEKAPLAFTKNIEVMRKVLAGFEPQVVISDFESTAYFYARINRVPVISIDNMQVINRCRHDRFVSDDESFAFRLAKLAVKAKLPGAYHYLVSSFFFPPVRKPRTTLVPPILRPEILTAKREPAAHVLVYQTQHGNTALLESLKAIGDVEFRVYGMVKAGEAERSEGNVKLKAFSETGFVDDLRTARAVIAGGGYSLMGEAVHLRVPMLSMPIGGQYEQELNARYLQKLGYGMFLDQPADGGRPLDREVVADFLEKTPAMARALESYVPRDNGMLCACIDELLRDVDIDEPPPQRLETRALGSWEGPDLPPHLLEAVENDEEVTARPGQVPSGSGGRADTDE
jgi:uncharacterized protein (TIGR00661 family)